MGPASWVFGYGSLVWRPAFGFAERRPAYVRGFARRFWQGSTDHRGVPGAPGRVVTLVPAPGARCWGIAYRLRAADAPGILAGLDHREKGGYDRHELALHDDTGCFATGVVYVASQGNPNHLGPAALEAVVRQVRASSGPSGANVEYVERLAAALRAMRPELSAQDDEALLVAEALES